MLFLCPFSKAAWYSFPWFIKTEIIAEYHPSVPEMIQDFLTSQHPQINVNMLYTFLWFLWKARNNILFCKLVSWPSQIYAAANAINKVNQFRREQLHIFARK
jgi:hypothetical protein